jgi:hypothetical protein
VRVRTLLAPIHNPDNLLLAPLEKGLPALLPLYEHLIFAVSKETTEETVSLLKKPPQVIIVESNGYFVGARNALQKALGYPGAYHWVDADRILHWISAFPDELKAILISAPQWAYTILGRTARAKSTHPQSWIHCEFPCNRLAGRKFGLDDLDVCVANVLLSRRALELIAKHSTSRNWGILTEWPLIIQRFLGRNELGYVAVEGNEWEDPDRYAAEIQNAGGLDKWNARQYDNESEWLKRLQNAIDIIIPLKEG